MGRREVNDLACITETWMDEGPGQVVAQMVLAGYILQHQPRKVERGTDGVSAVCKENMVHRRYMLPIFFSMEFVYIVLKAGHRLGILLVYSSPHNTAD